MNHISVFKKEIVENLNIESGSTYLDLTLGAGGHSLAIWDKLQSGTLVSFDVDTKSLESFVFKSGLKYDQSDAGTWKLVDGDKTWWLINRNFNNLKQTLLDLEIAGANGIIADLGWSTDQLESVPGLSYVSSSNLDMRLDPTLQVQAKDLLNGLYRKELLEIFANNADIYGKLANTLVDKILDFRRQHKFETTDDLLKIIDALTSAKFRGSRSRTQDTGTLPARVFQALRIAVNTELSTLQSGLRQAWEVLLAGGSLEVITFHSGEDRIVKQLFHKWVVEAKATNLFTNDFLQPSIEELQANLRSRSAKLRGVRKN